MTCDHQIIIDKTSWPYEFVEYEHQAERVGVSKVGSPGPRKPSLG